MRKSLALNYKQIFRAATNTNNKFQTVNIYKAQGSGWHYQQKQQKLTVLVLLLTPRNSRVATCHLAGSLVTQSPRAAITSQGPDLTQHGAWRSAAPAHVEHLSSPTRKCSPTGRALLRKVSTGREGFCLTHTKMLHVWAVTLSKRVRKLIKKKKSFLFISKIVTAKNKCSENSSVWSQNRKCHYKSTGRWSNHKCAHRHQARANWRQGGGPGLASYKLTVNLKARSQWLCVRENHPGSFLQHIHVQGRNLGVQRTEKAPKSLWHSPLEVHHLQGLFNFWCSNQRFTGHLLICNINPLETEIRLFSYPHPPSHLTE